MTAVVFETPGLIDVRAFTIMGAHAKPNSANPIGFFGTGLKYAMAVLVRMGAEPVVWIGRDRFSFSRKMSKFRGTDLETIKMIVLRAGNKRATSYELPFTTRYGANWKPWMAFRELESNTRDEGGRTFTIDRPDLWDNFHGGPDDGKTYIIIDHPDFTHAADCINEIFLPRGRREGTLLEAFPGESNHLYYRTMRAMDLGKPSLFTYNLLEVQTLTEDRTLAYSFQVRDTLARWVLTEAAESQVETILTADGDTWEHGLEFPGHVAPSEAFRAVMARRPRGLGKAPWVYYGRYAPSARHRALAGPWRLGDAHPRPWRVEGLEVLDAGGQAVLAAPDGYYDDWQRTAQAVVDRVNLSGRLALPERAEVIEAEVIEPTSEALADDAIPF